jgi:hypothetical protein
MITSGAGKPNHDLAASIALLVETGFEIEYITHTALKSKIGASVDSVSLAVSFGGECLISQFSSTWLTTTRTTGTSTIHPHCPSTTITPHFNFFFPGPINNSPSLGIRT